MRTPMLMLGLVVAGAAAAQTPKPASPPAASALGRLFFTPEQRDQLDLLRLRKVSASQSRDETPAESVSYEGIVRRADGSTTVWVNSKALAERELREMPSIAGRVERDGRLLLRSGEGTVALPLRLKVGQRAELRSGKVEDWPAADTRNASGQAAKPAAETRTGDAGSKAVSAPGRIPEKLPLQGVGDPVK